MEDNKALLKSVNVFALACRDNKLENLKHLLDRETRVLNDSSTAAERNEVYKKIFAADEADNTACYYAIRSNDIDLLETLLNPVSPGSTILYESLSKDYESLRLKNVFIHETMEIFVEDRLVRERFLINVVNPCESPLSGSKNVSNPEYNLYERLNLIIRAAKEFTEFPSCRYDHNHRLFVANLIATNVHASKNQLGSTYDQLPWEEMEFYLSRYSLLPTVERKKLKRHLIKFVGKLKSIFGFRDESSGDSESEVLEEIRRHSQGKVPVNRRKVDGFEDLYNDYELIKDEYSLNRMLRYIKLALSVNPEEQSGKLTIQRALHVVGEYVKNSPKSPHLSERARETLTSSIRNSVDVVPLLRDTLSHIEELRMLSLQNSIENQRGIFTKLQDDLIRVVHVIVDVLCFVKVKRFQRWCQDIIHEDDIHEFEELCEGFLDYLSESEFPYVEATEIYALNIVENMLTRMRNMLHENRTELAESEILSALTEVEAIVGSEKNDISNRITTFNATFHFSIKEILQHLRDLQLSKSTKDTSCTIAARDKSKVLFKYTMFNVNLLHNYRTFGKCDEVVKLLDRIYESIVLVKQYAKLSKLINGIMLILSSKSYVFVSKAIEEYKEKFDASDHDRNIESDLDDTFTAFDGLGSEEAFLQLQEKKEIHKILSKVKEKHELTERELCVVKEKLRTKRSEGKKLLGKAAYCYGDFLGKKREFKTFVGSLVPAKSGEERSKLIAIFDEIASQRGDDDRECVLFESIRQIEDQLTKERYKNLIDKFETIKRDHYARLQLLNFFDSDAELEEEKYQELVNSLDMKSKDKLKKLYPFIKNIDAIAEKLEDAYGVLKNVVKNKELKVEKMCNSYVQFIDSLQLTCDTKKLLKSTIIKNKVFKTLGEEFSKKLNLLREILGNVETRGSKFRLISRYRSDEKLQAVVEMLLFGLCNVGMTVDALSSKFMATTRAMPLKFLEQGFMYLNGNLPFLKDNSLRNYLAHGNPLIDSLHFDSSIAIISSAILFCEEGESLMALKNDNPDQLLPQNHPIESFKTLRKSNYWKHYLKTKIATPVVEINVCSRYKEYTTQCVSQESLFEAVIQGKRQKLKCLFETGAEIHSRDSRMESLLHIAANEGHEEIVQLLLNNGINIDATDKDGKTSLHLAARNGHRLIVETLLKNGANVHAIDANACTSLHYAACFEGPTDVASTLLRYGADSDARSSSGSTLLHNAALIGNLDVIKLLVEEYTANVHLETNEGYKPLHMAAKGVHNNEKVFEYFHNESSVCLDSEDIYEIVPLLLAVKAGNDKVVEAIFRKGNVNYLSDSNGKSLLWEAAKNGNGKIMKMLLENGCHVDAVLWHGRTALHIASQCGDSNLVEFLINAGAKVDIKTDDGRTPLYEAAESGNYGSVKCLVETGRCNVNACNNFDETPLLVAISNGNLDVVKYLLKHKARLEAINKKGWSLLHYWVNSKCNDFKIADYLIDDLNFDCNVYDNDGFTPLANAVNCGTLNVIEYLVQKGARLNVRTNNNETLLHVAVARGNLDVVEYLLNKVFTNNDDIINAVDGQGNTALLYATSQGQTNIVNTLLKTKSDKSFVNTCNIHNMSPLHYAILHGHTSMFEALIKNGARVNGSHESGLAPLELAIAFGSPKMVNILLMKGADANYKNIQGSTPLLFAAALDEAEIVELLLKFKGKINLANDSRNTPLHIAAKCGNYKTAKVLVNWGADINVLDKNGRTPLQCAIDKDHHDIQQLIMTKMN